MIHKISIAYISVSGNRKSVNILCSIFLELRSGIRIGISIIFNINTYAVLGNGSCKSCSRIIVQILFYKVFACFPNTVRKIIILIRILCCSRIRICGKQNCIAVCSDSKTIALERAEIQVLKKFIA